MNTLLLSLLLVFAGVITLWGCVRLCRYVEKKRETEGEDIPAWLYQGGNIKQIPLWYEALGAISAIVGLAAVFCIVWGLAGLVSFLL